MTVGDIIKAVRSCIDEETANVSGLALASAFDFDNGQHSDNNTMDGIIRNRICDALRWVCLNAPTERLGVMAASCDIDVIDEHIYNHPSSTVTLPVEFLRLIRVKGNDWHRAIMGESLLREDSDEYLQLKDAYAAATVERPQAAFINTKVKAIEVAPVAQSVLVTCVVAPVAPTGGISDTTTVNVPPAVETSFVYFLAYLLLVAYGDSRAEAMYHVATQNLGLKER